MSEKLPSSLDKKDYEDTYFKLMGRIFQQLHESKKIDIFCRLFLTGKFRRDFYKGDLQTSPSRLEAFLYNRYSE